MVTLKDVLDEGFKPYRKYYDYKKHEFEYLPCDKPFHFSSMSEGYVDVRLIKEGTEIIYGLLEAGHPPTFINKYLGYTNMEVQESLRELTINDLISVFADKMVKI